MQESQRRLLTGLLVAAVVVGAAAVGSRLMNQASAAHSALSRATQRLGDGTQITFRVREGTGRVDTSTFSAQALGVTRLTPVQVAAQLPGWAMQVAPGGVTLTPKHGAKPLYVGILQGQVAVFFGPPRYGWVDQLTGLRAQGLGRSDLSRLAAGVPVANVGQAWQLLEGLGG